jgi:hypothetical protein
MRIPELIQRFRDDAGEWCVGRSWIWRVPLLLFLAYVGVRLVLDPYRGTIFSGITFGIHELGHVIFSFLGMFIGLAGGSLAHLLAPAAAGLLLLRQRDYFGVAVTGAWLSFSLYDLAIYVGDARARQLPLLGLTSDPLHDWHYLLSTMGLLKFDAGLAFATRAAGFLILIGSLGLGGWLCWRMAVRREED